MGRLCVVISVIILISIAQSCEQPERTTMTKAEKDLVDSIYATKVGGVRKEADAQCRRLYQATFDNAVDSFFQLEVREIEQIINGEG